MTDYLNANIYGNPLDYSYFSNDSTSLLPASPYLSGWGNYGGYDGNNYNLSSFSWDNYPGGSSVTETPSEDSTAERPRGSHYTYEDYEKERYALAQQMIEHKRAVDTTNTQLSEIKTSIETVDEGIKDIKKSKKKDGSAVVSKSRKDMNFWQRAGRLFKNMGKGIVNIGKSFIGIDENGKWNWKKCLKNVAIAAACIGACFIPGGVGLVAGYALAATGVIGGAIGIGKSAVAMSKAKTDEEKDIAQQNLGAGIFTTVTSAVGLRGVARAAGTATTATTATNATSSGSRLASLGTKISNFGKDISVNAYKGAKNAYKNIGPEWNAQFRADGKFSGKEFWSAYKGNISDALRPKHYGNKFTNKKTDILNKLDDQIRNLDTEIAAKSGTERAMLECQKEALLSVKNKTNTAKTKADWDALSQNDDIAALNELMHAEQAGATESMLATIKRLSKENSKLLDKLDKLSRAKQKAMREMADSHKKYRTPELDKYVSSEAPETGLLSRLKPGNKYQKMLEHNSRTKAMLRGLYDVSIAPAGGWIKVQEGVLWPIYSEDGIYLSPEMVAEQMQALEAQKAELEAILKEQEAALKALDSTKV